VAKRSGHFDDLYDKPVDDPFSEEIPIDNEYLLGLGENLPNHSQSQIGRGKYITPKVTQVPLFRTKQSAYRFAGWLVTMAEMLPDEDERKLTFHQIVKAIRNT